MTYSIYFPDTDTFVIDLAVLSEDLGDDVFAWGESPDAEDATLLDTEQKAHKYAAQISERTNRETFVCINF